MATQQHEHFIGKVSTPDEQFQTIENQEYAGRLGLWLFLGSEVLLFAALFALYTVYRVMYGADFVGAQFFNDALMGTINTVVLISSSFTVAWSIHCIKVGKTGTAKLMLVLTMLGAVAFMVVKGFEYARHFHEGLYPGQMYAPTPEAIEHAAELSEKYHVVFDLNSYGANSFFTLYYFLTGLHAIHVIIGLSILIWAFWRMNKGTYGTKHYLGLELAGLYWHLVDLVWIFLWPLLYLTGL